MIIPEGDVQLATDIIWMAKEKITSKAGSMIRED